jgi:tRNA A-37 threonylcarbamoyl transferase component Bud32
LKKTAVAILTVKRLLKNRMTDSWRSLRVNQVITRVRANNEGNLLAIAAAQILKNKESNLVKLGF